MRIYDHGSLVQEKDLLDRMGICDEKKAAEDKALAEEQQRQRDVEKAREQLETGDSDYMRGAAGTADESSSLASGAVETAAQESKGADKTAENPTESAEADVDEPTAGNARKDRSSFVATPPPEQLGTEIEIQVKRAYPTAISSQPLQIITVITTTTTIITIIIIIIIIPCIDSRVVTLRILPTCLSVNAHPLIFQHLGVSGAQTCTRWHPRSLYILTHVSIHSFCVNLIRTRRWPKS